MYFAAFIGHLESVAPPIRSQDVGPHLRKTYAPAPRSDPQGGRGREGGGPSRAIVKTAAMTTASATEEVSATESLVAGLQVRSSTRWPRRQASITPALSAVSSARSGPAWAISLSALLKYMRLGTFRHGSTA